MQQSHRSKAARFWQIWRHLGARRDVAIFMLILGAGRLGLFRTTPVANFLSTEAYGALLVGGALALAGTTRWRYHWWGRGAAVLCAALLAGMAVDVGTLSVTSLIYTWLAYLLAEEALA